MSRVGFGWVLCGLQAMGCQPAEPPRTPVLTPGTLQANVEETLPVAVPPPKRLMVRSDADLRGATTPEAVTWLILEGPGITDVVMERLVAFSGITRLTLRSTGVTDSGLRHVAGLARLGKLKLSDNAGISNAGLAPIARLGALYWLDFESQVLSSNGLASLGPMPGLRRLHLAYREGVPPVLPALSQFSGLERLYIQSPELEDDHLRALDGPSRVSVLDLSGSPIGGEGLRFLSGFTALRELYLRHTALGDTGFSKLPELPQLQVLDLHGTQLGDAGIDGFEACGRLRHVYLGETNVSPSAESGLQQRCPALETHRSGGSPRGRVP